MLGQHSPFSRAGFLFAAILISVTTLACSDVASPSADAEEIGELSMSSVESSTCLEHVENTAEAADEYADVVKELKDPVKDQEDVTAAIDQVLDAFDVVSGAHDALIESCSEEESSEEQSITVEVAGSNNIANPVTVTVPGNTTVSLDGISGVVCLDGTLGCTGPSGITASECNDETVDECAGVDDCGTGAYGALVRNSCQAVVSESFVSPSSGEIAFFVNSDPDPSNNTGAFSVTVSY